MESSKNNKIKKTVGIVINVLLWLFVIFAVVVTIIAVSAVSNKKNLPTIGGTCYLSVRSDSMNATKPDGVAADKPNGFKTGDLIFSKFISGNDEEIQKLEVGDVITFEYDLNSDGVTSPGEYNTHRITALNFGKDGKIESFETMGDNFEYSHGKGETVVIAKVLAVYTGSKISGLGSALNFLSSSLGFGLCILLPLVLFFGYELFVFIKTLLKVKNEGKKVITAEDEELIKQRAIEEYLKRKQEESGENQTHDDQ